MALEGCRISSARREISDREEAAYGADEGTLPPCDWPRDPVETDAVRLGPSKWNLITVPMRGQGALRRTGYCGQRLTDLRERKEVDGGGGGKGGRKGEKRGNRDGEGRNGAPVNGAGN